MELSLFELLFGVLGALLSLVPGSVLNGSCGSCFTIVKDDDDDDGPTPTPPTPPTPPTLVEDDDAVEGVIEVRDDGSKLLADDVKTDLLLLLLLFPPPGVNGAPPTLTPPGVEGR